MQLLPPLLSHKGLLPPEPTFPLPPSILLYKGSLYFLLPYFFCIYYDSVSDSWYRIVPFAFLFLPFYMYTMEQKSCLSFLFSLTKSPISHTHDLDPHIWLSSLTNLASMVSPLRIYLLFLPFEMYYVRQERKEREKGDEVKQGEVLARDWWTSKREVCCVVLCF